LTDSPKKTFKISYSEGTAGPSKALYLGRFIEACKECQYWKIRMKFLNL
jgi:hypothetical protein